MNTTRPLMTTREVAELIGMSPRWVLTQFEHGRIPGFKLGDTPKGRVRFSPDEIEQWLRAQHRGPELAPQRVDELEEADPE